MTADDVFGVLSSEFVECSRKSHPVLASPHQWRFILELPHSNYVFTGSEKWLCCSAEAKKPLYGETWLRGHDVMDGKDPDEVLKKSIEAIKIEARRSSNA